MLQSKVVFRADARGVRPGTARTKSATVTLIAAVAFITVATALGIGLDAPTRASPYWGWRLRGTLANTGRAATEVGM